MNVLTSLFSYITFGGTLFIVRGEVLSLAVSRISVRVKLTRHLGSLIAVDLVLIGVEACLRRVNRGGRGSSFITAVPGFHL